MDYQISIYDHLKASFANAFVGKIDQTIDLHSPLPTILIEFPITEPSSNKDRARRDFVNCMVHVINKDYQTALQASETVRTALDGFEDEYVYTSDFDGIKIEREDEAEVYRIILEFQITV